MEPAQGSQSPATPAAGTGKSRGQRQQREAEWLGGQHCEHCAPLSAMALVAQRAAGTRGHAVPKSWAGPGQHWKLQLPSLGPWARGRAGLTQMTRFGEPMLEPGGEMEVSDVLLCCGGTKREGR